MASEAINHQHVYNHGIGMHRRASQHGPFGGEANALRTRYATSLLGSSSITITVSSTTRYSGVTVNIGSDRAISGAILRLRYDTMTPALLRCAMVAMAWVIEDLPSFPATHFQRSPTSSITCLVYVGNGRRSSFRG